YIGKDARNTARGTILSGLFSIPFFAITGAIGLVALAMNPDIDPNTALPFVVKEVLPVGIKGVVIAGIVSIVMSSADSFLNGAAIALTNDIIQPLRTQKLTTRQALIVAKIATFVVGVLAVVFAVSIESVLDILIYAYNFWAPIILVPLIGVLLGVRANLPAMLGGAAAGIVGTLGWNHFLADLTNFDGLVIGVLCNTVVFSFIATFQHPSHKTP
ncbi:MAG: sodium:solute symporter family transporter, partial [Candidatus Sumerlaeota bacterium]